jgi:hypothetical protein
VKKAVRLFILSSLLYLPVLFYQNNFNIERFYERLFSFITLIEGGYFHLWYLSSFVLGLILWKSLDVLNVRALKIVLSTAIIVAYFYADLTGNEHTNVFRHFVGLPFLLIGSKLAKQQHTNDKHIKTLGFCFPFILFLYFFEPYWSNFIGFTGPVKRQFPFFTILVAPLLFLLFYNLKFKLFTQRLSKIGLEHALGIYIFHPIFLLIAFKVMSEFGLSHSIVALFSGFLSTILFLELLKRWLPSLHSFLLAK